MRTLKNLIYILPLLIIISLEDGLMELFILNENSSYYNDVLQLFVPISILLPIIFLNKLSDYLKVVFIISLLYFTFLILESLHDYDSYFQYPHVFSKITPIFLVFYSFTYSSKINLYRIDILSFLIVAGICLNLIIINPESLSFTSFVEHNRGINGSAVYLLLFACIHFFNKYFYTNKLIYFILFIFLTALIIFLQHRTVWVSFVFAIFLNLFILIRTNKLQLHTTVKGTIFSVIIVAFLSVTILSQEKIQEKIGNNIEEILNPTTKSTGNWRWEQFQAYLPYMAENFLDGMRFEGFELPIQFYNPATGLVTFGENTGHHFHSFYVDKVFYLGLIGLIIYLSLYFYIIKLSMKIKTFDSQSLTHFVFSLSGLIYGISYDWPIWFYCIFGMSMWFVYNNYSKTINNNEIHHERGENNTTIQENIMAPINSNL